MTALIFEIYSEAYFEEWFQMSLALFPEYSKDQLKMDLKRVIESGNQETFLAKKEGTVVGFINVSVRHDYVEGAISSPVGYIEAIYVQPDHRKQAVARGLVQMAEKWASRKGCRQMGSDTWVSNRRARNFHLQLGYREEDILVHFIKDIDG